MPSALWLLMLAASIRENNTPLLASCGEGERVIARLAAGVTVEIRFAVTSGMPCYKVVTQVNGETAQGYVAVRAVAGKEEFERNRMAGDNTAVQVMKPEAKLRPAVGGDALLHRAWALIQASQPREAAELLEPALDKFKLNPQALAVAGLAAYRADNPQRALELWDQSVALEANPHVEILRERAAREVRHDQSRDSLTGLRVALRYEGTSVPAEAARQMIATLDDEFSRISSQLGCRADERIVAIVQTPAAYRASMQAAEWSGGLFDGRIHVPLMEGAKVGAATKQTFAHELVHACLANLGPFPAWLHEGLAQRLSGEALHPQARAMVQEAIAKRALPKLQDLGQNWSGLSAEHARMAYSLAWMAVEQLEQNHGALGLRTILASPGLVVLKTEQLNKSLGLD